jgi:hypothetical protein
MDFIDVCCGLVGSSLHPYIINKAKNKIVLTIVINEYFNLAEFISIPLSLVAPNGWRLPPEADPKENIWASQPLAEKYFLLYCLTFITVPG